MLSFTFDTTSLSQLAVVALPGEGGKDLGSLLNFAPGAVLWTWIAFFVALPVMWKMVYGPITRALEDRDQKVEDSIAAAEVALSFKSSCRVQRYRRWGVGRLRL